MLNRMAVERKRAGCVDEAVQLYQESIRLAPDLAEAHYNLALTWHDLGRLDAAADCLERARQLRPDVADIHFALGNVAFEQGNWTAARGGFERAIARRPNFPQAHFNLGNVLMRLGLLADAVESYSQAIELDSELADALTNRGNAMLELGCPEAAVDDYHRSLQLRPDHAETWSNLGKTAKQQKDPQAAERCYARAAALRPDLGEVQVNLGALYKEQGRWDEARQCFRRAMELEPDQPLHALRLASFCPLVFTSREEMDGYVRQLDGCIERVRRSARRWPADVLLRSASEPTFNLQFLDGPLHGLLRRYADVYAQCFAASPPELPERPRIGIVVTRGHEGIFLRSKRGLLERTKLHDCELVVACAASAAPHIGPALEGQPIRLLPISRRFEIATEQLRAERFSVLYYWEIGTDALNYFLPMQRIAPVQCTSWGRQLTSGMQSVDWYLGSELVEAPEADEHYTERLARARTLLTYQYVPQTVDDGTSGRADFGFRDWQHVYVTAQNLGKMHLDFDPLLRRILEADGAGLVAIVGDDGDCWNQRLQDRLERNLGAVAGRVRLLPRLEPQQYLRLLAAADVLLDPPHFGGVNSTYDALASGKPLVTRPTRFHRGRYTQACYRMMGLTELVAADDDQYVATAVRLGTDAGYRRDVARAIRRCAAALFEDDLAVREWNRLLAALVDEAHGN